MLADQHWLKINMLENLIPRSQPRPTEWKIQPMDVSMPLPDSCEADLGLGTTGVSLVNLPLQWLSWQDTDLMSPFPEMPHNPVSYEQFVPIYK